MARNCVAPALLLLGAGTGVSADRGLRHAAEGERMTTQTRRRTRTGSGGNCRRSCAKAHAGTGRFRMRWRSRRGSRGCRIRHRAMRYCFQPLRHCRWNRQTLKLWDRRGRHHWAGSVECVAAAESSAAGPHGGAELCLARRIEMMPGGKEEGVKPPARPERWTRTVAAAMGLSTQRSDDIRSLPSLLCSTVKSSSRSALSASRRSAGKTIEGFGRPRSNAQTD